MEWKGLRRNNMGGGVLLCFVLLLLLLSKVRAIPLPGGVTSRFLGLDFDDTSSSATTTAPSDKSPTITGSLTISATGGVDGAGFASGFSGSNYLSFDLPYYSGWSAGRAGDMDRTFVAWYKGTQLHDCAASGPS